MKLGLKRRFHFDVEKYERPIRIAGWFMAVFTLFSLLSVVSYFFTWKLDQSLLLDPEMMDRAVEVSNLGGKAGLPAAGREEDLKAALTKQYSTR